MKNKLFLTFILLQQTAFCETHTPQNFEQKEINGPNSCSPMTEEEQNTLTDIFKKINKDKSYSDSDLEHIRVKTIQILKHSFYRVFGIHLESPMVQEGFPAIKMIIMQELKKFCIATYGLATYQRFIRDPLGRLSETDFMKETTQRIKDLKN